MHAIRWPIALSSKSYHHHRCRKRNTKTHMAHGPITRKNGGSHARPHRYVCARAKSWKYYNFSKSGWLLKQRYTRWRRNDTQNDVVDDHSRITIKNPPRKIHSRISFIYTIHIYTYYVQERLRDDDDNDGAQCNHEKHFKLDSLTLPPRFNQHTVLLIHVLLSFPPPVPPVSRCSKQHPLFAAPRLFLSHCHV